MSKSAESYVSEFLDSSGFPLEMQVARALAQKGFNVEQARHYVDVNSGQLRESDVLAVTQRPTSLYPGMVWAELRLVVECKQSSKPWVLFVGDDRFTSPQEHLASLDVVTYKGVEMAKPREGEMLLIAHMGDVAYRVSTAHEKDSAFAAVQQVDSAVRGIQRDLFDPETYDGEPVAVVFVPVVVVGAPLFECRLDSTGQVATKEVDAGLLLTRLRDDEQRLHAVWIVGGNAVDVFAGLAHDTASQMTIDTSQGHR